MKRLPIALLAPLLFATACTAGPDTEALSTGDDYSVLGALAEVPAAAGKEEILLGTADLVEASRAAGLTRPESAEGRDGIADWIGPLTGGVGADRMHAPVMVPLGSLLRQHVMAPTSEVASELGWSLLDADAFVEVGPPPDSFVVAIGEGIGPADGLPEVTEGVVTAGEGEDHSTDLGNVTAARPTGAPLRMAGVEDKVAASNTTSLVKDWLSEGETLAADPTLAAVAGALDEADVVSAVIERGRSMSLVDVLAGRMATPEQVAAVQATYDGLVPADPFTAVGIGFGVDDGRARVTVAFHFADDAGAAAAVPVFERQYEEANLLRTGSPVSEVFELLGATADGPLVVLELAPVEGRSVHLVYEQLLTGDLPFVHE